MVEKLDFYDVVGMLVPGALLVFVVAILFPSISLYVAATGLPDSFVAAGLLALAFFAGQLLQAIGSECEGLLYSMWGGNPREMAFEGKLPKRYLAEDAASRITERLRREYGQDETDGSLFLRAVGLANGRTGARHERFNALYAYHRGCVALMAVSMLLDRKSVV